MIGSHTKIPGATTMAVQPPPAIEPLPEGPRRPLFSVMIPVYNAAPGFLRETLLSVLRQDMGPEEMEIEVIDNCSTSGQPEKIVEAVGGGRIRYHRQPTNVGAIGNFNSCLRRARGEWVHLLHADDTLRPGFYARAKHAIATNPAVGAVTFRVTYIDHLGKWTGFSELEAPRPMILPAQFAWRQLVAQRFQCVGMIVRRSAYEELGGFRATLPHCADWDMWNRLAVSNQLFYEPEPLACYRKHPAADSSSVFRSGENVRDEKRSIHLSRSYVPRDQSRRLVREAMRHAAIRAGRQAKQFLKRGEWPGAGRQIKEALHCSVAPGVVVHLAYLMGLAMVETVMDFSDES